MDLEKVPITSLLDKLHSLYVTNVAYTKSPINMLFYSKILEEHNAVLASSIKEEVNEELLKKEKEEIIASSYNYVHTNKKRFISEL
jgi:hypothetical protein